MAEQTPGKESSPFDIARIRQLVRLMRDNDLTEIDLRWEHSRVRLRRGNDDQVTVSGPKSVANSAALDSPANPSTSASPKVEDPESAILITSPIVGTFFVAPSPDSEPFVKVGSKVSAETIVCIVEAMKVFNEIPAGMMGTIVGVLVENGAPVEYGQAMFRIEPD